MNGSSSLLLVCGLWCMPALLMLALGIFIGRYKPKLRSPIALNYEDTTGPTAIKPGTAEARAVLRKVAQKDNPGYGGQ